MVRRQHLTRCIELRGVGTDEEVLMVCLRSGFDAFPLLYSRTTTKHLYYDEKNYFSHPQLKAMNGRRVITLYLALNGVRFCYLGLGMRGLHGIRFQAMNLGHAESFGYGQVRFVGSRICCSGGVGSGEWGV